MGMKLVGWGEGEGRVSAFCVGQRTTQPFQIFFLIPFSMTFNPSIKNKEKIGFGIEAKSI